jgi:hypothetical protein
LLLLDTLCLSRGLSGTLSARLGVLQTTGEVTRAVGELRSGRSLWWSKVTALAGPLLGVVLAVMAVGARLALCLGGRSNGTRLGELLLETAWGNGGLAGTVGVDVASGRVGDVVVVGVQMGLAGVLLHGLPALAVVQLHPVVLAILNLATVLQCLSE